MYADSIAVLGPLALRAEPGSYDLCDAHAVTMTPPRGWEIIRLPAADQPDPQPDQDDLLALADAVREVGLALDPEPVAASVPRGVVEIGRRRHLTVLADPDA